MRCNNCGQIIPKDSEFCQYCGKTISIPEEVLEIESIEEKCNNTDVIVKNDSKSATKNLKRLTLNKSIVFLTITSFLLITVSVLLTLSIIKNNSVNKKYNSTKAQLETYKKTIEEQKKEIQSMKIHSDELEEEIWDNFDKLEFFNSKAEIVGDDGTYLYHKYGCPQLDLSYFWIFNTEAAISNGYRECPICH